MLLVGEEEVKVTDPLGHKVTGPAGEIVGVLNVPATVTTIVFYVKVGQPPTIFCTE